MKETYRYKSKRLSEIRKDFKDAYLRCDTETYEKLRAEAYVIDGELKKASNQLGVFKINQFDALKRNYNAIMIGLGIFFCSVLFFSCSKEDDDCQDQVNEINTLYTAILENDGLSAEQRREITSTYKKELETPCDF